MTRATWVQIPTLLVSGAAKIQTDCDSLLGLDITPSVFVPNFLPSPLHNGIPAGNIIEDAEFWL